ncbi:MAG: arsenic transporter [Clostridiales bacterium]|nr:arsenic transporter [Clostridiales bacterium]
MKIIALVIFIATYVAMLLFQKVRAYIALGAAALFIIIGILPIGQVLNAIDWNIIMMLAGTMGTVALFIETRMPARLADLMLSKVPDVRWAIISLALFAGVISAFVDNVATVLMVAPVGLAISKKLDISPISVLISIAVSSNLQGAATLVGDTTSILLGSYAKMDFLDFFFMKGKPGIFWAVELGALAPVPVLLYIFRKGKEPIEDGGITEVQDLFPSYLLIGTVVLLILASFIKNKPSVTNGIICLAIFVIGLIRTAIVKKSFGSLKEFIKEIDYSTLMLLAGLFMVISGITEVGLIDDISSLFVKFGGDNLFLLYTLIVFGSVFFSAFIDNIPYVATMLPVITGISTLMSIEPYLLYFGLLTGATLGGNITPIGASANIAAIGILRKEGYTVKNKDFFKIGLPFTLSAVLTGYIYIWLFWKPV